MPAHNSVTPNIVNGHHVYYARDGRRGISGFPHDNNSSIVKSTSAQEFLTFEGYRDSNYHYEFQNRYGTCPYATERCDRFYETYFNREIDYIVLHRGRQKSCRVRVVNKVEIGGRYFLELQFV